MDGHVYRRDVHLPLRRASRLDARQLHRRHRCGAAHRPGLHALSRRERPHRHRHRRAPDRAAGQRRRGHDLHAVLQRRRRDLQSHRHVQDRHGSQLRAGPRAEPRVERARPAAPGSAEPGRHRPEEIDLDPDVRHARLARGTLRQPLSEQLRNHQAQGRAGAPAGRGRRHRVRRRPVFHAHLARPEQAAVARAHGPGCDPGDPAAEPAGDLGASRSAAHAVRPGVPAHHQRRRPARRPGRVRGRDRQGRQRRRRDPRARRRPRRVGRPDLQPGLHGQRQAGRRHRHLSRARRQCPRRGARGQGAHGPIGARIPAGPDLRRAVRHHHLRARRGQRGLQDVDRGCGPRARRDPGVPAGLARDPGAGDHRAGDHHRRPCTRSASP